MIRHGFNNVHLLPEVSFIHAWDYYIHSQARHAYSLCPRGLRDHHGCRALWLRCDSVQWSFLPLENCSAQILDPSGICYSLNCVPPPESAHQSPSLQYQGMWPYFETLSAKAMNCLRISIMPFHPV